MDGMDATTIDLHAAVPFAYLAGRSKFTGGPFSNIFFA